jgi:peptidoglycan/xylan/chitin deacetylase (PgdA/CDA1 family)
MSARTGRGFYDRHEVTRSAPSLPRSRQARAAAVLQRSGLGAMLRRLGAWRGLLVLNYHRIGEPGSCALDRDLFSATADQFERHVAHVARACDVIALDDVPAALGANRGRRVLITFDDGYRDNFDLAFPILRAAGMPAAFFLATGFLDRPRLSWWDELAWMGAGREAVERYKRLPAGEGEAFLGEAAHRSGRGRAGPREAEGVWMTWDMAREMRDAGMAFGGHTVHHPVLAALPAEHQRREIGGCAQRLADELGITMRAFSYPVGSPDAFDETTKRLVREAGCDIAFAFAGGRARPGATDPLAIPRMTVVTWLSTDEVRAATTLPQLFARW